MSSSGVAVRSRCWLGSGDDRLGRPDLRRAASFCGLLDLAAPVALPRVLLRLRLLPATGAYVKLVCFVWRRIALTIVQQAPRRASQY
jgi:hypothetical protein